MKVMSFNVLCGGEEEKDYERRKNLVPSLIENYMPDTIGLQEAHINWIKTLKAALPQYDYVGIGRNDGKEEGEFSAVFFLKDKFEVINSGNFWLSETPDVPGKGWDAVCIRICSFAVLKEKSSGKIFAHFNTHLDHKGATAKIEGAKLILEKAKEFDSLPIIFTGDFNSWPESAVYEAVSESGFFDARETAEITDDMYTFHGYDKYYDVDYKHIIDYIFLKNIGTVDSFKTITDKIDGVFPSDHFPILAEIDF